MSSEAPAAPAPPPTEGGESAAASRSFTGAAALALALLGGIISAGHIWLNTLGTLSTQWQSALHYAGFALLCAVLFPLASPRGRIAGRVLLACDVAIGALAAASALYLIQQESAIYARGVRMSALEIAAALVCIATALELVRRTTGWIVPALIVAALTYVVWWGAWIDGMFKFAGLSAETVLFRSIYADEGMFGSIARISSTIVFMFVLFAAFLVRSGASDVIVDLARAAVGRLAGGPGLVAVFASGLTGTISGSAVANTVATGSVTIPLMKEAGFPPRFAAGVEAAASTGGQLMPPIMGAGAFVMANFTGISYSAIIAAAALPAVLYFVSVAYYVRIEARRQNLGGDHAVPRLIDILRRGGLAFVLPVLLLVGLLVAGFTPTYAAGFATLSVIAASWLTPRPMGPRAVLDALVLGARNMVAIAVLLVAIGLAINVVATTGIGNTFSLMITQWAGGNLVAAIALIALASLVLGMGLPVTAAYIMLATVSAPALAELIANLHLVEAIAATGVPEAARPVFLLIAPERAADLAGPMPAAAARELLALVPADFRATLTGQILPAGAVTAAVLAAHMIIFWLSQDSNVTPPVCLAAFAAAAIARTPPMRTGLTAWKISKGLYVVPLLFAYTDLLTGSFAEQLRVFAFSLVGLYAFSAAMQGWIEGPIGWPGRLVAAAAAVACLWPRDWLLDLAGVAAFAVLFAWSLRTGRRHRRAAARFAFAPDATKG